MRNDLGYKVLLHETTFKRAQQYLDALKERQALPGQYLKSALSGHKLDDLDMATFLDLLVNTKQPQIFAESSVHGDGRDWNPRELAILGDISFAVSVTVFDDGRHSRPSIHDEPFPATLLFTPGALLNNYLGQTPADYDSVVTDGKIDEEKYLALYERRLVPGLLYADSLAGAMNRKAFITVPGLGCGCFAGAFQGRLGEVLAVTMERLLIKHQKALPHVRCVYYDPYSEGKNRRLEIGSLSFLTRPFVHGNERLSQLSRVSLYESGEFADCMPFSFVAWDHVSWPGNDFFGGSRATDDGVKAAATDSMHALTGVEGRYCLKTNRYMPPAEYASWGDVVERTGCKLEITKNLLVLP